MYSILTDVLADKAYVKGNNFQKSRNLQILGIRRVTCCCSMLSTHLEITEEPVYIPTY
jgi:hypothetical protein